MNYSILEDGRCVEVDATLAGGRVLLSASDLEHALGWTLKPQGLCRNEICVPVPPASGVLSDGKVDLAAFAELMDRPLALDTEEHAAAIGESAGERATLMRGGLAPDFTLPDLSGHTHSLSDYRGRKALLIAWASW